MPAYLPGSICNSGVTSIKNKVNVNIHICVHLILCCTISRDVLGQFRLGGGHSRKKSPAIFFDQLFYMEIFNISKYRISFGQTFLCALMSLLYDQLS